MKKEMIIGKRKKKKNKEIKGMKECRKRDKEGGKDWSNGEKKNEKGSQWRKEEEGIREERSEGM